MANSVTSNRMGTVLSGVVAVGLVAGLAASSLGHHGTSSSEVSLTAGTAWFADRSTGQVSLLDGATGSRVSVQKVANPGDNISVVQSGTQSGAGAYVVDQTTGQAVRVDGATLEHSAPVRLSSPGDSSLSVVSNTKASWAIVQSGSLAEEIDPATLSTLGTPHSLATTEPPVETPDGSLWTTGDGGFVYSFSGGQPRTRTHPIAGQFSLVEADNRPVLADASAGKLYILDPATGNPERAVVYDPAGSAPIVAGSGAAPYLLSVNPSGGELQVSDLDTGTTSVAVIGNPASSGSSYGAPAINGDYVFVPNYAQQSVVVAKLQGGQLSVLGQIGVDDGSFQVLNYDGSVWFDDPGSDLAGVITPTFDAIEIPKSGGNGSGHTVGHLTPINLGGGPHQSTATTVPHGSKGGTSTPTTVATGASATTLVTTPVVTPVIPTSPGGGGSGAGTSNQNPQPSFSLFPTVVKAGQPETFTDTTQGPHKVFQWTFASATPGTSTATSPTVTWKLPGTYQVTLVVTQNGQSFPYQKTITVVSGHGQSATTTTLASGHGGTSPSTTTTIPETTTTTLPTTTTTTLPPGLAGYQVVQQNYSLDAGQYLDNVADCPAGDVVLGGGAGVIGDGTANFDTLIEQSDPGTSGGGETYLWDVGIRNNSSSNYTIGVFADCAQAPPGYQIVQATANVNASSVMSGTASCPAGTVLLGGGASVFYDGISEHDTTLEQSFPETDGTWTIQLDNRSSNTYTIGTSAICSDTLAGYQQVATGYTLDAGSYIRDSAACPGSEVVMGGGEGYGGSQQLGGGHGRVVTVTFTMMEDEPGTLDESSIFLASVSGSGSASEPLNIYAICATSG